MVWWDERQVGGGYSGTSGIPVKKFKAVVDLDCEYTRMIVANCFDLRPEWQVDVKLLGSDVEECEECVAYGESIQFLWAEYERIDWSAVEKGYLWASSYCIRKGLIRKAHLAHNMKKWGAKRPDGWIAKCIPESYILDLDDPMYLEEALCDIPEVRDMKEGSKTWIAKPSLTNQGHSICIFDRVSMLAAAVEEADEMREWVIQEYIHPPLLVHGRKFHLRVYALCIGSLRAYIYSDILMLLAGTPYDLSLNNLADLGSHLTNTCRQSEGQDSSLFDEDAVVKLLSDLPKELAQDGYNEAEAICRTKELTRQIALIIGECFEAVSGELTFFTLPNCFELFGFDVMVDQDWHCWLLEANAEPDFKQTGGRLQHVVENLIEGAMDLIVDPIAGKGRDSTTADQKNFEKGEWLPVFSQSTRRPF